MKHIHVYLLSIERRYINCSNFLKPSIILHRVAEVYLTDSHYDQLMYHYFDIWDHSVCQLGVDILL
jgi:hypothetical protein